MVSRIHDRDTACRGVSGDDREQRASGYVVPMPCGTQAPGSGCSRCQTKVRLSAAEQAVSTLDVFRELAVLLNDRTDEQGKKFPPPPSSVELDSDGSSSSEDEMVRPKVRSVVVRVSLTERRRVSGHDRDTARRGVSGHDRDTARRGVSGHDRDTMRRGVSGHDRDTSSSRKRAHPDARHHHHSSAKRARSSKGVYTAYHHSPRRGRH